MIAAARPCRRCEQLLGDDDDTCLICQLELRGVDLLRAPDALLYFVGVVLAPRRRPVRSSSLRLARRIFGGVQNATCSVPVVDHPN